VKTLDLGGLGNGSAFDIVTSLRVLLRSRGLSRISASLMASSVLLSFSFFISDKFVRGIPHRFVLVWPFGFIYKVGRKPISRNNDHPLQNIQSLCSNKKKFVFSNIWI
jgi:hypothetical protein